MSYIYLIRHGRPETPDNRTYCIGRNSDPHLSADGQRQAKALNECFEGLKFNKVYHSTLECSRETAELLSDGRWPTCEHAGISEIGVGFWEGLSFDEIRKEYPDIYAARGKDWAISPPGGESLEKAADRIEMAIKEIAEEEAAAGETNDLLAVTHDGAIRALLWRLMGLDTKKDVMIRQPYGSITVLRYSDGQLSATAMGKLPEDSPTDEEIEELWNLCNTASDVRAYCNAVCEEALKIREQLKDAGLFLSPERLRAAALLHDMCRHEGKEHPWIATGILRERGYLRVARLLELQHGGDFDDGISEAEVLYLADKRIDGKRDLEALYIENKINKKLEEIT